MRDGETVGRIVENLPTAAAAMPPNRVRAILINRHRPGFADSRERANNDRMFFDESKRSYGEIIRHENGSTMIA